MALNKIDFAVIFNVSNANPNGDPLNGNRPRVNYDGLGEVSDVCIKRKIRNRLMEDDHIIFVQSEDNCTDTHINLKSRWDSVIPENLNKREKADLACKTWFDVRSFGQVVPFKAKKSKKESETNDEQSDSISIGIRGPVSIHPAFSVDLVEISSSQITKSTSLEGDGNKRTSDQMGMKYRIDSGTYVFYGSINPQLAKKTGFSEEDAAAIKKVLPRLFENDASSARPEGSMEVKNVLWWQHNCPNGQVSSAKVHRSLHVNADGAFTLTDIEGLVPEIIEGY
jgi:CRISPR-associated protein Csd2